MKIYKGNIVWTAKPEQFEILNNAFIGVDQGRVQFVCESLPIEFSKNEVEDFGENLIIPGFVDLHFHAPQYANLGLGLDKELLPWLTDYTFPEEAKYADLDYASGVFKKVAYDLWRNGTTRVVLLSTLHRQATEKLMEIMDQSGLGAYVGKVNMDRNSPDNLIEKTEESIEQTRLWLERTNALYPRVKPIITPRFVPTCTSTLMHGLADLSKAFNVPVQSHISENTSECEWVKALHPEAKDYVDVYEKHGLMHNRTVMAHCVHNSMEEIKRFAELGVYAAHCPNANYNLSSGIMPVRTFLNEKVNVGLGTDVGAGHKVAISQVMVSAIQGSKLVWLESKKTMSPLTLSEAFYLGTKGGGAFFGSVGSFEVGYEFDALVIDDSTLSVGASRSIEERLQRFIYVGDDRQIVKRFVAGKEVGNPLELK